MAVLTSVTLKIKEQGIKEAISVILDVILMKQTKPLLHGFTGNTSVAQNAVGVAS